MLVRPAIRLGTSLIAIAVGIIVSAAVLSRLSITATAVIEATLVFWFVHLATQFMALKVLVHQPSIALVGLLAVASTVLALIIVNVVVNGLSIHGLNTYVFATLIIWVMTSIGAITARQMIRARRDERVAQRV
jgi:hypothetical protein